MDLQTTNNVAVAFGEVVNEPVYSHRSFDETFFSAEIKVERLSHVTDTIPVIVSEKLIDLEEEYAGKKVMVRGQFRSLNIEIAGKRRLKLYLFADTFQEDEPEKGEDNNYVFLSGTICRVPNFRETPMGREISDILLAINRPSGKSDYIPCICWGRNARYSRSLKTGDVINITGRMQSRPYRKRMPDGDVVERVAYECSISKMELLEDEKKAI